MAESSDCEHADVCDQLDNLSMEILNTMQNIILERQYLDDNLKEGFINMAKSRYLMKEQKIGILQISTSNLRASKEIISDIDQNDVIKFTSYHIKDKKKSLDAFMESHPDTESSSPREREKTTTNSKISENYPSEEGFQNSQRNSFSSVQNPLNWFGVLVPDSLKTCQSRFEQAIETSAKIVSLQNQLKALNEEYKKFRKQKSVLDSKIESELK